MSARHGLVREHQVLQPTELLPAGQGGGLPGEVSSRVCVHHVRPHGLELPVPVGHLRRGVVLQRERNQQLRGLPGRQTVRPDREQCAGDQCVLQERSVHAHQGEAGARVGQVDFEYRRQPRPVSGRWLPQPDRALRGRVRGGLDYVLLLLAKEGRQNAQEDLCAAG